MLDEDLEIMEKEERDKDDMPLPLQAYQEEPEPERRYIPNPQNILIFVGEGIISKKAAQRIKKGLSVGYIYEPDYADVMEELSGEDYTNNQ